MSPVDTMCHELRCEDKQVGHVADLPQERMAPGPTVRKEGPRDLTLGIPACQFSAIQEIGAQHTSIMRPLDQACIFETILKSF